MDDLSSKIKTIQQISIKLFHSRYVISFLLLLPFAIVILISGCNRTPSRFILIDDLDTLYETTDRVVYFGRKTCVSCGAATKYLLEVVSECTEDIYYFDTDKFRENDMFQTVLTDFKIDTVPMLVKISNGEYAEGFSLVTESGNLDKTSIKEALGLD